MAPGGGVHAKVGLALVPDSVMLLTKGACCAVEGSVTTALARSLPLLKLSVQGPYSERSSAMTRWKKLGIDGPGLKAMLRDTAAPVSRFVVVPKPVVPKLPLGVTELAPMRKKVPAPKPSELTARCSRFMNGVVMVTGAASAAVGASSTSSRVARALDGEW